MSDLSRRWGRRRSSTLALAVLTLGLVGAPVWPASAIDPGPSGAAAATQDGWWNRLQGPQEGEPEGNPLRTAAPPLPAPPTVPADATAVAAAAGQPLFVAAVGIDVAVPPGGVVDSLKLILKEAPSGNIGAESAKVIACPAVIPWGPGKNAAWRDRPEADCELARADGTRGDDATWTFDLTGLGSKWVDPFAPLAQNGVVLGLDTAASPGPTQVAWSDFDSGGIVVELIATVVPGSETGGDVPGLAPDGTFTYPSFAEFSPTPEGAATTEPAAFDFGTVFTEPLTFATDEPTFPTFEPSVGVVTPAPIEGPATTELVTTPPNPAQPTGALRAQPVVGYWEGLPAPTVLLVPVALALAVLVGLVLGPAGRPLPTWPRAGGLTRALARRRSSGGDAVV